MSYRFKFQYKDEYYEVNGTYGYKQNEGFFVIKLIEGATRMMRATGGGVSGVKVVETIQATSESDLLDKLNLIFAGLTDFHSMHPV